MFFLSHHYPEEYHRTYLLLGVRWCARCLGVYPALALALAFQFYVHAPLTWRWDVPLALGLFLPGLLDWTYGRVRPEAGSNGVRTLTGVLLGLSLGRTLYVHFQRPFPLSLLLQGACAGVCVFFVVGRGLLRK